MLIKSGAAISIDRAQALLFVLYVPCINLGTCEVGPFPQSSSLPRRSRRTPRRPSCPGVVKIMKRRQRPASCVSIYYSEWCQPSRDLLSVIMFYRDSDSTPTILVSSVVRLVGAGGRHISRKVYLLGGLNSANISTVLLYK